MAMMGIVSPMAELLIRLVASSPSMPGRLMSMRMKNGRSRRARSTPCSPVTAVMISYSCFLSAYAMSFKLSLLSSTTSTFFIFSCSYGDNYSKSASLVFLAGDRYFTFQDLGDELFCQVQTQGGAQHRRPERGVETDERMKEFGEVVFIDADAGVLDDDFDIIEIIVELGVSSPD